MKKYFTAAAFVLATTIAGYASCTVYFFTGAIEVISGNKPPHTLTNINEPVQDNDALKIPENAEVILKNTAGQFAIIHASGTYNNVQINEEFKKQQGKSLVSSLANFLGSEITRNKADIRKMAESYMKQKGGVTRGGSVYPLMLWPAYGSINDSNQVKFIWNSVAKVDSYEIIIFGGEDANNPVELGRTITPDTFLDVNFKDFGISSDAYFSWVVYPKGDPNHSRFTFKIITPDELKKILDEVQVNANKGASPEDKLLIRASNLEKKGLIVLADKTYKDLIAGGQGDVYKQLYMLFRLRNNLID